MNREFNTILDECLTQLKAGTSVEDCLALHAEHADALRPILVLAAAVQTVPVPRPDPAVVAANQQRMLQAVQARAARPLAGGVLRPGWTWAPSLLRLGVVMAMLLLLVAFGTGVVVRAATSSLPGDTLYPVKRFAEEVQLSLTRDSLARQQLETRFAQVRQDEVWALLDMRREALISFDGPLSRIEEGVWTVAGFKLDVTGETVVEGQPLVGALVQVQAMALADGSLQALRLQVQLDPTLPTVTPSLTPMPSATPTPLPPTATRTPVPTSTETSVLLDRATATPTHTPALTDTEEPQPTERPEATGTGEPEPTPTPRPRPRSTEEAESSDEPEPTNKSEPEHTDEPDDTRSPEPEHTDEPEGTRRPEPEHTDKPEPTRIPDPQETDHPEHEETREPGPSDSPAPWPTEREGPEPPPSPGPSPTDDD